MPLLTDSYDLPGADTRRRRRASDWAGFIGHTGVAVITIVRTPWISVFLLPSIVHLMLAATSFLMRDRPRALVSDPAARVAAYCGAFGVFAFVNIATIVRPEWLTANTDPRVAVVAVLCGFGGVFIEIWAIWHLRYAFATEPAARRLVTTGPYRYARHPIYSGACLAQLGLLLTHPTIAVAIVLAAWVACIRFRIGYEEDVLLRTFPEYADYRRRVGALFSPPRLLRTTSLPS